MKKVVLLLILAIFTAGAHSQGVPAAFDLSNYGVRIEPDRRVIVVLATLDAARTIGDPGGNGRLINTRLSDAGKGFRSRLDSELAIPDDLRQKISIFMTQYRKRRPKATDAEIVTPFVSMAYTLTPAPELADPVITSDLPGDLLDVLDFAPLVREFYRRTGISAKLDDYVKEYRKAADGTLRQSTREMVSDLLDYLHTRPQTIFAEKVRTQTQKGKSKRAVLDNVETRERERRFVVVPEMLAPAGNVQFLNIRDDYYVIVPPDADLSYSDARRAFLQYVVDAIVLTNAKDISAIRPAVKQLLDERRKVTPNLSPDPFLAVSRSLVAAIDARQPEYTRVTSATNIARQKIATLKTDTERRAVSSKLEEFKQAQADETALRLSEDYEKGAVLAFYFAAQLRGLEDSGFDIAASMRDMLLSLDASKEINRLSEFADARKRAAASRESRKNSPAPTEITAVENPVTTRLLEIQKSIDSKDYIRATADLKQLAETAPGEPRIYYNLGRVANLQAEATTDSDAQARKLLEAKTAYSNVIRTATPTTDRALLSLTYVALARIYEFYNERDTAGKLYDKAIELSEVPGGAYSEALVGKQRLLKNP